MIATVHSESSGGKAAPEGELKELAILRLKEKQWAIEKKIYELKIDKLQRIIWGKKSERLVPDKKQTALFEEPASETATADVPAEELSTTTPSTGKRKACVKKGLKPLDPNLPREVTQVPGPDLKELICPVTGKLMQPAFAEQIEVLARRAPEYYVKVFERCVFVSPAKTAPVYAPWPSDILPRARVHASIVAHIAAAHYCEHVPYHRLERQLARTGVELPRVCQVSLMGQLDRLVEPLLKALKTEIFSGGYLHVDATPIDLCDPERAGKVREATLWAYRAKSGAVWFEYQKSKSPNHPDATLKAMNFRGLCQTDGAPGLDAIGPPGQVMSLGCWSHCRRPLFDAHKAGDPRAKRYLEQIGKLFRVERIAQHHGRKERLRRRFSLPIFEALLKQAEAHTEVAPAKTDLGDAVRYLLGQRERLRRCLAVAEAEISNNAVERAVRPLKLGARNWLFIGNPSAGPRLANLFTLVENCRLLGIDPERYLSNLIARLPDHPASKIAELLPHHWQGAPAGSS